MLAGIPEFDRASGVADIGVVDDQMGRLVFFVFRAGVVKIGQLVEGKLAVAFCGTNDVSFGPSIKREFRELAHVLVASMRGITVAQAASTGDHGAAHVA